MVTRFTHPLLFTAAFTIACATSAFAQQDISLAGGGADQTWAGTQPNANAGRWLDQGAVSNDSRRDLIIGAPGTGSIAGAVYVIFGGPDRTGAFVLSSAETVITSSEAGNRFGASTAAGNIRNTEGTVPRNLAVGAPGALGGRGAVYLFAGGFANGAHLTAANAVFVIAGAPGDQLGAAVATGDLDNDGYREIIVGAPGTNRVYVIKGGPSLSGTLDLSTTAASRTITSPGIGNVLTAGDVTGDEIYDLIIGAPSNNLVLLYAGLNGALPTDAVGSFFGLDAGDEAGAAIRILDIDGDGKRDLVITAPGADGPANGRANAGEVYVYLGPVGTGATTLGSANLVFFGSAADRRAGDGLTAGDINRDTPNDLVILAPGGSGGAGELDIYYGRSRSTIGVLQADGRRFIDFATAGQVSRRILGDAATASISSAQVFEVTGEGARDIIVGVAGAESAAGKLYFTISPKLRVSPSTLTLAANLGSSATSPTPVNVTNSSIVITGWQGTSTASWLSASPATGSIDQTHPGAFYAVASTSGLTAGTQTGRINVAATSPDLIMTLPVDVTFTVTDVRVIVDAPANGSKTSSATFTVSGWAADLSAASGTGVSEVQIYAYPDPGSGTPGVLLGSATIGLARPDVGAAFGSRFTNSGYSMQVSTLTLGKAYQITVFAKSTVTNAFMKSTSIAIGVGPNSPSPGTPTDPGPTPTPNPNPTPTGPDPTDPTTPTPDTRVAVNRTSLSFGATKNGSVKSNGQSVTVTFTAGSGTWSATPTASWMSIAPASGTGSGTFTVSLNPGTYAAGSQLTGSITINAPGVANAPLTIPVTVRAVASSLNPFGIVETPAPNSTGIVGGLPVTGWALDDIGISRVTVWRDAVAGEPVSSTNGKVFIGNAVLVDGARPDVDAIYSLPGDYQAGWGYLLLTNMLPDQGNGTFTIYAYADDVDGNTMLLGSRVITCDNAHATRPFGTIDTPDQGGTISGTSYVNFGWALAPQPRAIPTDGSTITVFIDGVPVGHPVYNQSRPDIQTLFPGRANTSGAVGYYIFDSTRLSNGVHTIAWGVTDNAGNTEGIGSRYFTVLNTTSSSVLTTPALMQGAAGVDSTTREAASAGAAAGQPSVSLDAIPVAAVPAYVQQGFEPNAPLQITESREGAPSMVRAQEMGIVRVTIGGPIAGDGEYEGYLLKGGRLASLPIGSFLDKKSGEFFWQPGVGFVGRYDLVFIRSANGMSARIPVTIEIAALGGK